VEVASFLAMQDQFPACIRDIPCYVRREFTATALNSVRFWRRPRVGLAKTSEYPCYFPDTIKGLAKTGSDQTGCPASQSGLS
jgi:hypothetical protein